MAKGKDATQTPLMQQYLTAKDGHKDALLFFRCGDFYELFFEDAVVAAKALDLTLTSRNKNAEDEIPMAGVPHHAVSSYIQRLLDQGFKVALCEQMADPATVKGIVPREVVRVVTPALVFDDSGLEAARNAYLVAVEVGDRGALGLAALDASTGELLCCEAPDEPSLVAEIMRLDPRELLVGPGADAAGDALVLARPALARRPDSRSLTEADAVTQLDALLGRGEAEKSARSLLARRAAARVVRYAQACEPGRALPVARLVEYVLGDSLILDASTQEHLELVRTLDGEARGALLTQIDATRTAMGARLLRRRLLAPRTRVAEIQARHEAVAFFLENPGLRVEVRARLARVGDLERLATKLLTERASPRDLVQLRESLAEYPCILRSIAESERGPAALGGAALALPPAEACSEALALLGRALADEPSARVADGNVIRDGFDPELDEARGLARGGQRMIVELENNLREETQISSLKLRYTRVFGWYIELTRTHVARAPQSWRRKQTIATGERYTNDVLDALSDRLAHAEERLAQREAELYAGLVRGLAAHVQRIREAAESLADWDVGSALAEVAHAQDYVRPEVDEGLVLEIEAGRHPVVERLAAAGNFVPNDALLDASEEANAARLWLVTGPNMAGKSTFMRQVALIVILAQMGSFVPARRARIGVVDRVLTRVGASDNLSRGESTFMVEMKETANVLRRATRRSLVVLDEIGRGTSTYDGLAIAWAVAEHLADVARCRALFATHYHELTVLGEGSAACANHSVSAREHDGDIVFFHKVQAGAASRSYGVACARLAGLPELVLGRARAILDGLESRGAVPGLPGKGASPAKGSRKDIPQLALFDAGKPAPPSPVLARLRATDTDRLTPLEALTLLVQLKAELGP